MKKWAVLGSGAWGTALSILLANNGFRVCLWARRPELASAISRSRENQQYLPGVCLPVNLEIDSDLASTVTDAEGVVFAVPSQSLRQVAQAAFPFMHQRQMALSASKGIEVVSLKRMTQILEEEIPGIPSGVISGPNFAREVARCVPTASVVASRSADVSRLAQKAFMTSSFRVYTNPDVIGVEMGGALKNIYAIGVGIIDGMELGHNARAAFMTRALSELVRLGVAMEADAATFSGLSGIGDLILTATGNLSRNRQCGMELGRGRSLEEILEQSRMVVEGVETTRAARLLARRHGVEMPLVEAMYSVLFDGRRPEDAIKDLMTRGPKREVEELVVGPFSQRGWG